MVKMANLFNSVELRRPQKNKFNLSHDHKLSLDMGTLTPILNLECVPGDIVNLNSSQLIRFMPLIAPVMHQVDVYTHYFFVPNRLLWDNWETFITGSKKGKVVAEEDMPEAPYIKISKNLSPNSVLSYLGVPNFEGDDVKISALSLAAYNFIYNEYYRDQNLQDDTLTPYELTDGQQTSGELLDVAEGRPLKRAWSHGYFTSALPWAQKGDQVTIPLGTTAPLLFERSGEPAELWNADGSPISIDNRADVGTNGASGSGYLEQFGATGDGVEIDVSKSHLVDLRQAVASTITDLRRAFKLQEWLERNAVGGTRYTEHIMAHFGVKNPDSRLNRPEYIGGGKSSVSFSEITQTSESINTPQGNLAGHGVNGGTGARINNYRVSEHGVIIGIMSIMPKPAYFQGLHKQFSRFHRLDYLWPTFAHIGEQAIENQELYLGNDGTVRKNTFGYIPRYSEYRYMESRVSGEMRDTLKYWHMAREFGNQPQLNSDFIQCDPTKRIFAVQDIPENDDDDTPPSIRKVDSLVGYVHFDLSVVRALPKYGTPML